MDIYEFFLQWNCGFLERRTLPPKSVMVGVKYTPAHVPGHYGALFPVFSTTELQPTMDPLKP